jgi:hypothetical protein
MIETSTKEAKAEPEELPYVMDDGTLVIPTKAPDRYHWWLNDLFDEDPPRLRVYQIRAEALERKLIADLAKKRLAAHPQSHSEEASAEPPEAVLELAADPGTA